jgi:hypothetical protein
MMTSDEQRNVDSPFDKLLVTGFYDGPTEGFAHSSDKVLYFFRLLDWDDGQDLRIFSIASLDSMKLDDAVSVIGKDQALKWPVCIVQPPLSADVESFIDRARANAITRAVVASRNLLRKLDVWRPISAGEALPTGGDWFTRLRLPRKSVEA